MQRVKDQSAAERARNVRVVVLDVDGVLTDGSLYVTASGEAFKRFDVKDGLGVELLQQSGIEVILVTARDSLSLRRRAKELGINEVIAGIRDKLSGLEELSTRRGIAMATICFMGDDLLDVPCLRVVGFAVAPNNASDCAKSCSHLVATRESGKGAVRELAEFILRAKSQLESAQDSLLSKVSQQGSRAPASGSKIGIIIPSRFGATRLPGKPLRMICGKPLIVHVYENALLAKADFVIVATDDSRIVETIHSIGGDVELTSSEHVNGTDRLSEVITRRNISPDTIIVNVQGDEPLLDPELITLVAAALMNRPAAGISTLATPISHSREIFDSNVVKVVVDNQNYARYFTRAPVPWHRDEFPLEIGTELASELMSSFLRHVGVYAYRAQTLAQIASMPSCAYELAESLEQLRALWWGVAIHVSVIEGAHSCGVDTEEDLALIERMMLDRATNAS
jgi:3-deoxy-manno-octulosonate cytidylyltransferase (CMP-KDO synthetase)